MNQKALKKGSTEKTLLLAALLFIICIQHQFIQCVLENLTVDTFDNSNVDKLKIPKAMLYKYQGIVKQVSTSSKIKLTNEDFGYSILKKY